MALFSRLFIRTKLAWMMTIILAVVSLAIFLFVPARLRLQALDGLTQKAGALTEMTAFAVAPGLAAEDRAAVAAALLGVRRNPDLVYLVVLDRGGQPFASFNQLIAEESGYQTTPMSRRGAGSRSVPRNETRGGFTPDGAIYQTMIPVRHQGRDVGRLYLGVATDRVREETARSRATIAIVTLLAFLVGVAAVFAISALITRPLRRIARVSEKIAEGDLHERARVTSEDEVGQLARSFNLMVDRLAAAQLELETLNRTLIERVDERTSELREEFEERTRAERALRQSEERYRLLFDRNLAGAYIATADGRILNCNDACARIFGYDSKEEFIADRGAISYLHEIDRAAIARRLRQEGTVTNQEVQLLGREGQAVWALENVRLIQGPDGGDGILEGILLDITARKKAEEEVTYRAYHDVLTGLPNRALFLDRAAVAIARAERNKRHVSVMFLDVDDLKTINDTLGHATGDALLQMLAKRLVDTLRREDTVARVGGDEFLVLLADIAAEEDAVLVAKKLQTRLAEPFVYDNDELHVSASIGVSVYPTDGGDAGTLIRNADAAMYRVKEAGGNDFELGSRIVSGGALGRLSVENELRRAIENDELCVYFQPQVELRTWKVTGVEALVRWQHEDSLIEPSGFISIAEHTGLITPLGEAVLRNACRQVVAWQRAGYATPYVGVNVSARQFYQRDFLGMVERVLSDCSLDPQHLELEITETVAVQKSDHGVKILQRLRDMGISIAIDDFGTGQSSLSYLKSFPVDTVKIDKSFVMEIFRRANDESIVTAILLLAQQLGLRTVAEGVESQGVCDFLRERGCDAIQGYIISRPLPAELFEREFLASDGSTAIARLANGSATLIEPNGEPAPPPPEPLRADSESRSSSKRKTTS